MKLFVVIRTLGEAWQPTLPLEGQQDWDAHAAFMNVLKKDDFVVLGGPLDGTPDVLLVVRANTPNEITERLEADPWTSLNLLKIRRIAPWTLRLGSLP